MARTRSPLRRRAFLRNVLGAAGLVTAVDRLPSGHVAAAEPADARPDELSDGMAISCDCVRLGPGWWQDMYFGWYFVYEPGFVARSLAGDHSWVKTFLESVPSGT